MPDPEDPTSNRLLAALPDADWQRWWPHLQRVALTAGQVLHPPGKPQTHAYFPTSAIVSLAYVLESGACAEVALVGAEGIVGSAQLLDGGATTICQSAVLFAGLGFRIDACIIKSEFERSDAMRTLFLRYTQALASQVSQTAVCNRHHSILQQVCGWLLHCLDRQRSSKVVVTQDVIASLLGVRRESVTQVAGQLQAAGMIRYTRGHIEVLDRAALERRACECHAVVLKEYDRLLPHAPAARSLSKWWAAAPAAMAAG